MNTFTLQHIADAPSRVTSLDPAILALAVGLLAAGLTMLWAPRLTTFRLIPRRRVRRSIATMAVGLAVLLTMMPSVLPWDHLFVDGGHQTNADEQVHAAHCHESPGTCSDAPVSAGPGQLMLASPLVVVPPLLGVLMFAASPLLAGVTIRPRIRPPLGRLEAPSI